MGSVQDTAKELSHLSLEQTKKVAERQSRFVISDEASFIRNEWFTESTTKDFEPKKYFEPNEETESDTWFTESTTEDLEPKKYFEPNEEIESDEELSNEDAIDHLNTSTDKSTENQDADYFTNMERIARRQVDHEYYLFKRKTKKYNLDPVEEGEMYKKSMKRWLDLFKTKPKEWFMPNAETTLVISYGDAENIFK